jgi:hypothetical protein
MAGADTPKPAKHAQKYKANIFACLFRLKIAILF